MKPNLLPFDCSRFTVMGETLAAGYKHFGVCREGQRWSFPAILAKQMGVDFPQVLLEPPGICYSPGFESQSVLLPTWLQSTVFETLPPPAPANLSVPGCTLADALERRVRPPLVDRHDIIQTGLNLIAGGRAIALNESKLPTLAEAAAARHPALLLVELGYAEAILAAVGGDPSLLPDRAAFRRHLTELLSLFPQTRVVLLGVPDPFDTPHFLTLDEVAETVRATPEAIARTYQVQYGDRLRVPGVHEIGGDLFGREIHELPGGTVISQCVVSEIGCCITQLNDEMKSAAASAGAYYCDLHGAMRALARCCFNAAGRCFTGRYLGGIFGIDGLFPGRTGNALLANQIILGINQATGAAIPVADVEEIAAGDPCRRQTPAGGRCRTESELNTMPRRHREVVCQPATKTDPSPPAPLGASHYGDTPLPTRLRLPQSGEQMLPLNRHCSYFGDAMSPIHCEEADEIMWGTSASHVFGGLALVDSHLRGNLRIRFGQPSGDICRFEVDFGEGFEGDDAVLTTPVMFRMPFQKNRVDSVPGTVSSGELNLATGEVTKLRIYARYSSAALNTLVGVNPTFPRTPLSFVSSDAADPQTEYGSAFVRFDQRPDGTLDFTFFGTRFLPLRGGIHWPLNFCGTDGEFALVPADGTIMRPHLRLSTVPTTAAAGVCPQLPVNTIQELTYQTRHCAFGDLFSVDIPALGGTAKGRSHELGRLLVQFGLPSGGTVPVAFCGLGPGGLFTPNDPNPISTLFPGRLTPGPSGFYEILRFPLRSYSMDEVSILDDPFDLPVGAVDLGTGRLLGEPVHRAFIVQDVIYAVAQVEPRARRSSWFFRGKGVFEADSRNQLRFRYWGEDHVPYPKGFRFPKPNFATAYVAQNDGVLEPYLWIRAVQDGSGNGSVMHGEGEGVLSSVGEVFSYHFQMTRDPNRCHLEYVNHTQGGRLTMHSLSWLGFGTSIATDIEGYDIVTVSGFGVWEKEGHRSLQPFAAQFCTNPKEAYVGIQVDAGYVSNVNTKPLEEPDALP